MELAFRVKMLVVDIRMMEREVRIVARVGLLTPVDGPLDDIQTVILALIRKVLGEKDCHPTCSTTDVQK